MNPIAVDYHPGAIEDLKDAYRWYKAESPLAAHRYRLAFRQAIQSLREQPWIGTPYLHGTRKVLLKNFPYLVVYHPARSGVYVIAVAHGHRKQGYWHKRLP